MTSQAAFLQAIREDPADDALRLIFADWLEDQGDLSLAARAEFLRVQVAHFRCERDPERRVTLRRRGEELLGQHRGAWLGPLAGLCHDVRFERGLAQITLDAARLLTPPLDGEAAELFDAAWVQTVRLEGAAVGMAELVEAPALEAITALDLDGNGLDDAALARLAASPRLGRLRHLDLANNNRLGNDGVRALASSPLLPRLAWLDLRNNRVGALGARALLRRAGPRLGWLDLHGNPYEAAAADLDTWRGLHERPWAGLGPPRLRNSVGLELVRIPAGTFRMGSDDEAHADEQPAHDVTLTRPFYLGVYAVTQGDYLRVLTDNPARFRPPRYTLAHPIECVSWDEAVVFCQRLSELPAEKAAGRVYRLPTEAEWEYACRADTTTAFCFGPALSSLQANFDGRHPSGGAAVGPMVDHTTAVGSYQPNAFGLYDVHGNVWEWCSDWYDPKYYAVSPATDPPGPRRGGRRVLRGGSWYLNGQHMRAAYRSNNVAPTTRDCYYGFRVAMDLVAER
jgi:uncharacterized protein (TIGR02996 family)